MAAVSYGAALRWVNKEFGGYVSEAEANVVTGAVAAQAAPNDPDALALVFVNFGAFDAFLSLIQNPPASFGIRLAAAGGSTTMTIRDDFTLVAREWFVNSPGGASSVYRLRLRFQGVTPQGAGAGG